MSDSKLRFRELGLPPGDDVFRQGAWDIVQQISLAVEADDETRVAHVVLNWLRGEIVTRTFGAGDPRTETFHLASGESEADVRNRLKALLRGSAEPG
jgi:hypothetical protein